MIIILFCKHPFLPFFSFPQLNYFNPPFFLNEKDIGFFNIYYNQGYLKTNPPVGTLRVTVRAPSQFSDAANLPYCLAHSPTGPGNTTNLPCLYWDRFSAFDVSDISALISTRVTVETYPDAPQGCGIYPTNPSCMLPDPSTPHFATYGGKTASYFVAQPENYTLGISHTVVGFSINYNADSSSLNGVLVDKQGKTVMEFPAGNGGFDILPLSTLMSAAGISSLDSLSETNNTFRYDGPVFIVFIDYIQSRNSNSLNYKYTIIRNPGIGTKQNLFLKV